MTLVLPFLKLYEPSSPMAPLYFIESIKCTYYFCTYMHVRDHSVKVRSLSVQLRAAFPEIHILL